MPYPYNRVKAVKLPNGLVLTGEHPLESHFDVVERHLKDNTAFNENDLEYSDYGYVYNGEFFTGDYLP
jgi:hypothetical protein